ncbi:20693_t:CDS:2, partial [Cetraspora pellucida]
IGKSVSVKDYNTFLDRNESTGYKFIWENENVYIIEMANREHEAVVSVLFKCFDRPNNSVIHGPIEIYGQPYHYNPIGHGEKIAPDIAVCPSNAHVLRPLIRHPGPLLGRAHARIICEVATAQGFDLWNTKCETWMHEEYVRCVLGIKLGSKRNIGTTRGAPAESVLSINANLAGVYVTEWDFSTIQYNNNTSTLTGCNASNLNAFQVTIPISDVFYDPP